MKVTFTGLDERTDFDRVFELSTRYAHFGIEIEWAVLYSANPNGRNRYPSLRNLKYGLLQGVLPNVGTAIHVCGTQGRENLWEGRIDELCERAGRIQVNGILEPYWVEVVCKRFPLHQIITQHNPETYRLFAAVESENHAILVDNSGGRGVTPDRWIRPTTKKNVGFAGGLGPRNIDGQMKQLRLLMETSDWIDMESGIRTHDDWLSLDACEAVLKILKEHCRE